MKVEQAECLSLSVEEENDEVLSRVGVLRVMLNPYGRRFKERTLLPPPNRYKIILNVTQLLISLNNLMLSSRTEVSNLLFNFQQHYYGTPFL